VRCFASLERFSVDWPLAVTAAPVQTIRLNQLVLQKKKPVFVSWQCFRIPIIEKRTGGRGGGVTRSINIYIYIYIYIHI